MSIFGDVAAIRVAADKIRPEVHQSLVTLGLVGAAGQVQVGQLGELLREVKTANGYLKRLVELLAPGPPVRAVIRLTHVTDQPGSAGPQVS